MRKVLLAIAAFASPAAAADQFDLVCQEQWRIRPNAQWQESETRYHMDLAANRWCAGECTETRPFAEITEGRLVLRRQERTNGNATQVLDWIDRRSGQISGRTSSLSYPDPSFYEFRGACQVAEFSGFPIPPTRF